MLNRRQGSEPRGPEPIGEVLSRLFIARGWGRKQDRLRLESAWAEAAGCRERWSAPPDHTAVDTSGENTTPGVAIFDSVSPRSVKRC